MTLIHRFSLLLSVCGGGFEQDGGVCGYLWGGLGNGGRGMKGDFGRFWDGILGWAEWVVCGV